jgi:hypothetical protein
VTQEKLIEGLQVFAGACVLGAMVCALFFVFITLVDSRVPAAPVPCHCQKCKAKCCEVGK